MDLLQAVVLAVVEGLTEYLPISSTGHIIIASAVLGIQEAPFTKDFTVIVQFGAILAVLVLYWRRFLPSWPFYRKLFLAFLPAAVIGLLLKNRIDALLGDVTVVAAALIAGGGVLLFVDRWFARQEDLLKQTGAGTSAGLADRHAVAIGLCQCLAFVPGVSRSAASIVGGLGVRLTRQAAAEFSFFLAVPTLTAATALKLFKAWRTLDATQLSSLLVGNAVSFAVALLAIRGFIGFLTRRGFFAFGVYRILLGTALLLYLATGHTLKLL